MIVLEGAETAMDVVLVPGRYHMESAQSARPATFFETSMHVAEGVWIAKLELDLVNAVFNACAPPGENYHPTRNFGAPYAFIRTNAPTAEPLRFDPDGKLAVAIALSRLVHPTSAGFQWAARIRLWSNPHRIIVPARFASLNPHAFVLDEASDWLVPADVEPLAELFTAYFSNRPNRRVMAGLQQYEFAARSHYVDARWPILVTGLEALIHIEDERDPSNPKKYAGSTRVFAQRVARLAALASVPGVTESDLREIYDRRSGVVHGQGLGHLDQRTRDLVSLTERVLVSALRRALTHATFGAMFESDEAVQAALPLS